MKEILIIVDNKPIELVLQPLNKTWFFYQRKFGEWLRETGTSFVKIFSGLNSDKLDKIS